MIQMTFAKYKELQDLNFTETGIGKLQTYSDLGYSDTKTNGMGRKVEFEGNIFVTILLKKNEVNNLKFEYKYTVRNLERCVF